MSTPSPLRPLNELSVNNRTVLLRADLNLPPNDDSRLRQHLPTIQHLQDHGASSIIVLSHYGRPKGQHVDQWSLAPIARLVSDALDQPVGFVPQPTPQALHRVQRAHNPQHSSGGVYLVENLRFHPGEETNDTDFAHQLATLGDVVVCDAFSAAHRAHASTAGLPALLPSAAGLALWNEWSGLQRVMQAAESPTIALVGGSKIDTKLPILIALLERIDTLILGGKLALPILAAQHPEIATSLINRLHLDTAEVATAHRVIAAAKPGQLLTPSDVVLATAFNASAQTCIRPIHAINTADPSFTLAPDLGPQTAQEIINTINKAQTVLWNGPLGAFEMAPFAQTTIAVAQSLAELSARNRLVIAGGGDTLAALKVAGVRGQLGIESLAGGAFLEFIERNGTLPGLTGLPPDPPR